MKRGPQSELPAYAFGFSNKKPGRLYWAIQIAMIATVAMVFLTACSQEQWAIDYSETQHQMLAEAIVSCRDGVEYLVSGVHQSAAITPHLKPDGTPFTCKEPTP